MVIERNLEYLDGTDKRLLGKTAYYVRIRREGHEHAKMFTISHYPSKEIALKKAREWKRHLLKIHGEFKRDRIVNKFKFKQSPSTGVVGVTKCHVKKRRADGLKVFEVNYAVSFVINGHIQTKSFYIGRQDAKTKKPLNYDSLIELKAFKLAVYVRELYNLFMDNGIVFDPYSINSFGWKNKPYNQLIKEIYCY